LRGEKNGKRCIKRKEDLVRYKEYTKINKLSGGTHMEETISLNEIFDVLKKRMKIIIASTVIIALLVALVSLFILTPMYEASSQFIVNEKTEDQINRVDTGAIKSNIDLINTYNVIITSPAILDDVVDKLSLDYGPGALASKINVSSEQNSQVVTVTVTDENQKKAADIANGVVSTFQTEIPEIMNVDNVSVLTVAEVLEDPSQVSPNVQLNIAIGLILGLMVGVGLAFLIEYLDTTVKTGKDIEKYIDIPIIGSISTVERDDLREEKLSENDAEQPKRSRA